MFRERIDRVRIKRRQTQRLICIQTESNCHKGRDKMCNIEKIKYSSKCGVCFKQCHVLTVVTRRVQINTPAVWLETSDPF